MSDAWKDRERAAEESYFDRQNKAALEKLARRQGNEVRKSPITGNPMEQRVLDGITVDVCKDSGGIWLDAGELEELIKVALEREKTSTSGSWLSSLLGGKK